MSFRRRMMMAANNKPYDAEIEYLESTGTQYIDTGIIPIVTDSIYCEFMLVSPLSSRDGSASIFGGFSSWSRNAFALVASPAKTNQANVWFLRGNTESYSTTTFANYTDYWQTATINSNTATFLGKTLTNNGNATILNSAYLFALNYNGKVYGLGSIKRIRKFQYKRNDNMILDLIPVRVGQVGYMYDRVSEQLFGNSGSGSFILGPDK